MYGHKIRYIELPDTTSNFNTEKYRTAIFSFILAKQTAELSIRDANRYWIDSYIDVYKGNSTPIPSAQKTPTGIFLVVRNRGINLASLHTVSFVDPD
jgi:hypothetical protein